MFFVFDFSKSGWLQTATVTNMPHNKTAFSAQQYSHHQLPAYPIMFPLLNFGIGQSFVNSLQLIVDENGFFEELRILMAPKVLSLLFVEQPKQTTMPSIVPPKTCLERPNLCQSSLF